MVPVNHIEIHICLRNFLKDVVSTEVFFVTSDAIPNFLN